MAILRLSLTSRESNLRQRRKASISPEANSFSNSCGSRRTGTVRLRVVRGISVASSARDLPNPVALPLLSLLQGASPRYWLGVAFSLGFPALDPTRRFLNHLTVCQSQRVRKKHLVIGVSPDTGPGQESYESRRLPFISTTHSSHSLTRSPRRRQRAACPVP